jgi:membrane protease YdiL (CAAX protease family)
MLKKIPSPGLRLDWKIAVLTVSSTLLLMVDAYHPVIIPWDRMYLFGKSLVPGWLDLSSKALDRTILYLIIPLLITVLLFRDKPGNFGFTLGDWRMGLLLLVGGVAIMAPVLWLLGRGDASMQNYYKTQVAGLPWNTFLDLFGWEFIFRGWLLFGYARKFGPEALWLQAVPFALAHIGKPEVETLSTIFGGFAFGWVAWKTKSFFWPFLIHWFVASFTILVAAGLIG